MPTFNPTIPKTDSEMKSIEMRDQFNSLKELIDDLTVRVAVLEPVTHEATGFGDARANGVLTQDGMWNPNPDVSGGA